MHKYTIENHQNEKYIFTIALISVAISPILSKLVTNFFLIINIEITITITASLLFSLLFFIANLIIGRVKWISRIFGVPCLSGKWICNGASYNYTKKDIYHWNGIVSIEQNWTRILVTLHTENSSSFSTSIIGNLKRIAGNGYLLTYIYENNPKVDQKELQKHIGVCKIRFDQNLMKAEADYFNQGRPTYGTMILRRRNK